MRKASKTELAEFFGISLQSVNVWTRSGCPVHKKGGKGIPYTYDLLEVAKWRFGTKQTSAAEFDPDKLNPKERLDWYRAESERRKIQIQDGELIEVIEYERAVSEIFEMTVNTLDALPDILERDTGITGDQVERAHASIDRLRERLYKKLIGEAEENQTKPKEAAQADPVEKADVQT